MGKRKTSDYSSSSIDSFPEDPARYRDPVNDVYEFDEFDMRTGEMSGQHKLTGNPTRKTSARLRNSRPRIDHIPSGLNEPSLDEGISFSQRLIDDDCY